MNSKTVSWIKIMEYIFLLHQIKKKVIKQRRAQAKDTLLPVLRTQTKYATNLPLTWKKRYIFSFGSHECCWICKKTSADVGSMDVKSVTIPFLKLLQSSGAMSY